MNPTVLSRIINRLAHDFDTVKITQIIERPNGSVIVLVESNGYERLCWFKQKALSEEEVRTSRHGEPMCGMCDSLI